MIFDDVAVVVNVVVDDDEMLSGENLHFAFGGISNPLESDAHLCAI